jgi:hypothetical protein
MQSAHDVQSTFLDVPHSISTGHLPHAVMGLRRAKSTSASLLEVHLQAAPVEQFAKITISLSSPLVGQGLETSDNVPNDSSPNADAETDFLPRLQIR